MKLLNDIGKVPSVEAFDLANKKEHPVEKEWHYPIMTRHGFEPVTKIAVGLVRSYLYKHPDGCEVRVATGASRDYWTALNRQGDWHKLEAFLEGR